MRRTFRLHVAFDGTDFYGWQNQPGLRTVQGVIEHALRRTLRHEVDLIGSGRTDAGVHAAGHVSSFTTTCEMTPEQLRHSIGSRLPKDVSITAVRPVHPEFHATRDAHSKLYRYRIHNARRGAVERLNQRCTYHFWESLDVEAMRAGGQHFIGEMDFTAMAATGGVRESMARTVLRCDVERHLDEIRIDVEGTGFLWKQVRNMVGTLINVGRGRWEPRRVAEILATHERANAGPTAPALGLCLQWVRYPPHLLSCPAPTEADDVPPSEHPAE